MDRNLFVAIALSLLVLTTWSFWQAQQDKARQAAMEQSLAEGGAAAPAPGTAPAPTAPPPPAPGVAPRPATPAAAPPVAELPERSFEVRSELYTAKLSSRGAGLTSWTLSQYRVAPRADAPPVELVTLGADRLVALGTPLEELGLGDLSRVVFEAEQPEPNRIVFTHRAQGIVVRKEFAFEPEGYGLGLTVDVRNDAGAAAVPAFEVEWPGVVRPGSDFTNESAVAFHEGSVQRTLLASVGDPGFFAKLGGSSGPVTTRFEGDVDWSGIDSHYFVAAVAADQPRDAIATFAPFEIGTAATVSLSFRPASVPPGFSAKRDLRIYLGPKERPRLEAFGASLEQSIDVGYRWAAPLTHFFTWLLHACYAVIPNYGVGIILLTVLVRVVTAPLTSRQMRSMKKMGELQPKLKELQEKYKDDRQRQSEEMMKLYREAGVNPLGGCLPILLQFPVFIGLYYALQSSIDLRHAPFVAWIRDLSAPEALFVVPGLDLPFRLLPIVMGLSMIAQQKLTPTTMDPAQARMMMTIMPVMFTVLFYQFPSGLVLYWLVSNLLAIGHQVWMNRASAPAK